MLGHSISIQQLPCASPFLILMIENKYATLCLSQSPVYGDLNYISWGPDLFFL